jgi:glycosyltransferase involved in cell wall biosynthesis
MENILFLLPHCSTGGMPQFVLRQIETLIEKHNIYLVEWENVTGGVFVVQRNKMQNLLGDRFFSLDHDKSRLFDIIEQISPSIIHFHEVPETFIDDAKLGKIFSNERDYKIVITTHSSSTNPSNFSFIADRYILVSEWSKEVFSNYFGDKVSCGIWEYPVDLIDYDKIPAKEEMGWNDGKTHVLNVGLFTRGKNQGELFELAKEMGDDFVFHFVGNQAMNFNEYWGPLMASVPKNCVIHGERNDVERFYMAADIFYFTSNYELSPLAVKEALGYGLPTFIKKLHTYKDMYDGKVVYITSDQKENKKNLLEKSGRKDIVVKQNRKDVKIVQVSSEPEKEREINSHSSLSTLGYRYIRILNPRFTEIPPLKNIIDGREDWYVGITKPNPDEWGLTSGHYGAWQGHMSAIMASFVDEDYSLICECDCLLNVDPEEFRNRVDEAINLLENTDYKIVRFEAPNQQVKFGDKVSENIYLGNIMTLGHCYMVHSKHRDWYLERYDSVGWHTPDWWLNFAFERVNEPMPSFKELVLTKQSEGFSIIDNTHRVEKNR